MLAALALCLVVAPDDDTRDLIRLKRGKPIEGRIVLEREDAIVVRIGSREREIDRDEIDSYTSLAATHREFLEKYRAAKRSDPKALLELARTFEPRGLEYDADLLYWRILAIDPNHDAAHQALGHRSTSRGWRVRVDKRWTTLEKASEDAIEWKNAWEFRSEHFELRSATPLLRALDTLFELEFMYAAFYALFQRDLELHELLEPIRTHVFSDRKEFPRAGTHVGAFFAVAENILYTYVERGRPYGLFHEGTHALLHNLGRNAARSRGAVPAWLDEGWAEYVDAVLVPDGDGAVTVEPGRLYPPKLRGLHAGERLYSIKTLMAFRANDFAASSRQAQKYAQSYALFYYGYDGERARFRESFVDYLKLAMAGQGSHSSLRKSFLKKDYDALVKGYVKLR